MKLASREDELLERGRSTGAAGSGRAGVLRLGVEVLTGALPKPLNTRGLSGWFCGRPRAGKLSVELKVLKLPLRLARGSGAGGLGASRRWGWESLVERVMGVAEVI